MEDWVFENFRHTLCYSGIYFPGSEASLMLTPSGASRPEGAFLENGSLDRNALLVCMHCLFHNDKVKQMFVSSFGNITVVLYRKNALFVNRFWYT